MLLFDPFGKFVSDPVADTSENFDFFFSRSLCFHRVVKWPVETVILAEESGPDSRRSGYPPKRSEREILLPFLST